MLILLLRGRYLSTRERQPIRSTSKGGAHEETQRPLRKTRRDLET